MGEVLTQEVAAVQWIWKIPAVLVIVVLLVLAMRTMNEIAELKKQHSAQAKQRLTHSEKKMKWLIRILVVCFVAVLIYALISAYSPLFRQ